MVHNGIEYGDMQLISEAYHILHSALNLNDDELANVFFYFYFYFKDDYLLITFIS